MTEPYTVIRHIPGQVAGDDLAAHIDATCQQWHDALAIAGDGYEPVGGLAVTTGWDGRHHGLHHGQTWIRVTGHVTRPAEDPDDVR